MSVLIVFACLFKAWMLFDSVKRGGLSCCCNIWLFIILLPFGDIVYFFSVKIFDPEFAPLFNFNLKKSVSVDSIRSTACHCPSIQNKKKLAAALFDNKSYLESLKVSEEVCKQDPNDTTAIYFRALALKELNRLQETKVLLEELVSKNFNSQDYEAARLLCDVYLGLDEQQKAIETANILARRSGKLVYHLYLIQIYSNLSRKEEAKTNLNLLFQDYKNAPRYIQRRDKYVIKEAKLLSNSLSQTS